MQAVNEKIELSAAALRAVKSMFNDKTVLNKEREAPSSEHTPSTALAELEKAGVIKMRGFTKGKFARTNAFVSLLVPLDSLTDLPRGRAASGTTNGATKPKKTGSAPVPRGTLSIEALERFVKDFRAALTAQNQASVKEAAAGIKAAQEAVAKATGDDDLANAMVMLSNALNAKRDAGKRAVQDVLKQMGREIDTTLKPVLDAMKE